MNLWIWKNYIGNSVSQKNNAMKPSALILVTSMVLLMYVSDAFSQQVRFSSSLLGDLSRALSGLSFPKTYPKDTVVFCDNIVKGVSVPVLIRTDPAGIVSHIGYHIADAGQPGDKFHEYALLFAGRMFLQMLVSDHNGELLSLYDSKGVSITVDGVRLLPGQDVDRKYLCGWLADCGRVSSGRSGQYGELELSSPGHQVRIEYSPSYELMYGMDKYEADVYIAYRLSNYKSCPDTSASCLSEQEVKLRQTGDSIWVRGSGSYMIAEINDSVTVTNGPDSSVQVVFTPEMPSESFKNAVLNAVDEDFVFAVSHDIYLETMSYTTASKDFFTFFADCDLYYGNISGDNGVMTGMLILKDRYSDCAHVAIVSASEEELFGFHVVNMSLLTNIPQNDLL